jgi:hypothetical protein
MVWIVVMTMAVYTHGSGLLLLPAFVIINWIYGSRCLTFTAAAAIPVFALIPWVIVCLPEYLSRGIEANVMTIYSDPSRVLAKLPFHFLSGEDPGGASLVPPLHKVGFQRELKVAAALLHLSLLVIASPKIHRIWPLRGNDDVTARWFWTAILLCGIPIVVLYLYSQIFLPVLNPRYVLIALPAYWVLLVLLGEFGGRVNRTILVAIVLPWILTSAGLTLLQHLTPPPVHQCAKLVAKSIRDSELILVDRHMPLGWQFYWEWTRRLKRKGNITILWSEMPEWLRNNPPGVHIESLNLDDVDRVWFFYLNKFKFQKRTVHEVTEYLQAQEFIIEDQFSVGLSYLTLFKRTDKNSFLPRGFLSQ